MPSLDLSCNVPSRRLNFSIDGVDLPGTRIFPGIGNLGGIGPAVTALKTVTLVTSDQRVIEPLGLWLVEQSAADTLIQMGPTLVQLQRAVPSSITDSGGKTTVELIFSQIFFKFPQED